MAIYYVAVNGRADGSGSPSDPMTVEAALARGHGGDVIQFMPGTYVTPFEIRRGGSPGRPLILRGQDGVVLDGGQPKEAGCDKFIPTAVDFAFIKLLGATEVGIERFSFVNCWPSVVFGQGCRDIRMAECSVTGGRFVFYAVNQREDDPEGGIKAKRIELDRVTWVQDPDKTMWSGAITWEDVKGWTTNNHSYFNGSLFSCYDIRGYVTIKNCSVSHAFNALRFDARVGSSVARRRNINVRILNNRFNYIRDNTFEIEKTGTGWWICGNQVYNGYTPFSLHGASGGYWYVFGNRLWSDAKPGKSGQGHRGGTMLKWQLDPPRPLWPIYYAHNSTFIHSTYAKSGLTRGLHHYNNAIEVCLSDTSPCTPERELFTDGSEGVDGIDHFIWDDTYDFRGDLCNHPKYPNDFPAEWAYRLEGTRDPRIFVDGRGGDLTLRADSPGRNQSVPFALKLPSGRIIPVPGGRNVGADQGNGRVFDELPYEPVPEELLMTCADRPMRHG